MISVLPSICPCRRCTLLVFFVRTQALLRGKVSFPIVHQYLIPRFDLADNLNHTITTMKLMVWLMKITVQCKFHQIDVIVESNIK